MSQRKKNYDPETDYMQKLQEAAARGDFEAAARYEQSRNEKIAGEGLSYAPTHDYEAYLPKSGSEQLSRLLAQLESKEPFTYDFNTDKLYQRYRDYYQSQAALAREDAVGQASALTGGYGNSYAQSLGQQAYDDTLGKVDALLPTLYDRAKEAYEDDYSALWERYVFLSEQDEARRKEERALEEQAYERAFAEEARAYERAQAERERDYSLALKLLQQGLMPSQGLLESSGLSEHEASQLLTGANAGGTSGGSAGGSGGSDSAEAEAAQGKALSSSVWTKLNELCLRAQKDGSTDEYRRYLSMLRAQGYDVAPFERWAAQTYGSAFGSAEEKPVETDSILALGYGPLSEQELAKLVESGRVLRLELSGSIRYVLNPDYGKGSNAPKLP